MPVVSDIQQIKFKRSDSKPSDGREASDQGEVFMLQTNNVEIITAQRYDA